MRVSMLLLNSRRSEGVQHEWQIDGICVGPEVRVSSDIYKEKETEGKSAGVKPSGRERLLLPKARIVASSKEGFPVTMSLNTGLIVLNHRV